MLLVIRVATFLPRSDWYQEGGVKAKEWLTKAHHSACIPRREHQQLQCSMMLFDAGIGVWSRYE